MSEKLHRFLPIWEIADHLKCPVAGTMLTVEKHRSILKKCGYNVKYMKPYGYHQKIMLKLGGENNVSQKVNNFIRIDRSGAEKYVTKYPILGYSADMWYDFINADKNP